MSGETLKPYRVEHHYPGTPHWLPVDEAADHEMARKVAAAFAKKFPNFDTRIVSQHVIEYESALAHG